MRSRVAARPCALRAVASTAGMAADYYPFDHAFLGRIANRIINEARDQPADPRHHVKAAGHDRVGVGARWK
jgi:hypothetical protein